MSRILASLLYGAVCPQDVHLSRGTGTLVSPGQSDTPHSAGQVWSSPSGMHQLRDFSCPWKLTYNLSPDCRKPCDLRWLPSRHCMDVGNLGKRTPRLACCVKQHLRLLSVGHMCEAAPRPAERGTLSSFASLQSVAAPGWAKTDPTGPPGNTHTQLCYWTVAHGR